MLSSARRRGVVEAADGTPIAFHSHGRLEADARTVLLTNGIGTTENFWRFLIAELEGNYNVVHWDYRGHGSTGPSVSGDYSIRTQADDLGRITRKVMEGGKPPPVHIAFSMGVAVVLELYRAEPGLFRALGLIAGAPDAPGTGTWLFKLPGSLAAAQAVAALATPAVPWLAPAVKLLLRSKLAYPAARVMGVIQPHAPRHDIDEFLLGVSRMDPLAYWMTLRGLLEASASDVLPTVSAPVLIVGAAKDMLMPAKQLEDMRRALPQASFVMIAGAGHAGLVEQGPQVAAAVRGLLDQIDG